MLDKPVVGVHQIVPLEAPHISLDRAWSEYPGLMRSIAAKDKEVVVLYDTALGRWCIGRRCRDGHVRLFKIWQDDTGGYKPLDTTLLVKLDEWDTQKHGPDAMADAMDAADEARAAKANADFDFDITKATNNRWNLRYLTRRFREAGF